MKKICSLLWLVCMSFIFYGDVFATQCRYVDDNGRLLVVIENGMIVPGQGNKSVLTRGHSDHNMPISSFPYYTLPPHTFSRASNLGDFVLYWDTEPPSDNEEYLLSGPNYYYFGGKVTLLDGICPDFVAIHHCSDTPMNFPSITISSDVMGGAPECPGWTSKHTCTVARLEGVVGEGPTGCSEMECFTYDYFLYEMRTAANQMGRCSANPVFEKALNDLSLHCDTVRRTTLYTLLNDCQTKCSGLRDDVLNICGPYGDIPVDFECGMSSNLRDWIFRILTIFRYLVPILVILLGVIDFMKAIASNSDDEFKKAGTRFAKRLIAAALVFIVPLLIQFVLDMFILPGVNPDNPYCL